MAILKTQPFNWINRTNIRFYSNISSCNEHLYRH